jgi:hypothetical protein
MRFRRCALLVSALGLVFLAPHQLLGQAEAQGFRNMMDDGGSITRTGFKEYAKILGLDQDQTAAAEALLDGYLTAQKDTSAQMRRAIDAARNQADAAGGGGNGGGQGGGGAGWQASAKVAQEYMTKAETLRNGFMDDVKALLTPEQTDRWPKVERYRRRQDLLRAAFVSGQSVDLIDVAKTMKLPVDGNPAMAETLDNYEVEMDRALVEGERLMKEMRDSMGGGQGGFEKMREMMGRAMDQSKAIRDVNSKYARVLGGMLPEDKVPAFQDEVRKRSFPRVFRQPYVGKAIDAANGFADLDQSQREQLAAIKASYEREAAPLNDRWIKTIQDDEASNTMPWGRGGTGGGGGRGNSDTPQGKAAQERRDLDTKTEEQVRAILTTAQRTRLPEQDQNNGGAGGRGPGGGGGRGRGQGGNRGAGQGNNGPQ